MSIREIVDIFLDRIIENIQADAGAKNQRIPQGFEKETSDDGGKLSVEHYFKFLVTGRGPGKQPPPDNMLDFVQKHPEILAELRQTFEKITERDAAFLIGRKIGRDGTDIYQGKKPGIDLQGSIDAAMPNFLERIAYQEALNVANKIPGKLVLT